MTTLIGDRHRAAQQEALDLPAALIPQIVELRLGFDTFGSHRDIQALAQPNNGADNRRRLIPCVDPVDEAAVDLDLVEREGLQRRQRRETGAEIVHRDPHPQHLQLTQVVDGAVLVTEQGRFGDLYFEAAGRQAGFQQDLGHPLRQVFLMDLERREIDRDR